MVPVISRSRDQKMDNIGRQKTLVVQKIHGIEENMALFHGGRCGIHMFVVQSFQKDDPMASLSSSCFRLCRYHLMGDRALVHKAGKCVGCRLCQS